MKSTKTEQKKIAAFAVDYMLRELTESRAFDFAALRDAICTEYPDRLFNWLTVVRSPMQQLINDGVMVRDTTDIRLLWDYATRSGDPLGAKIHW